jgi:hypothetical protein
VPESEISSYSGVIGGHFKSPDQMKFDRVYADLSHLHEWVMTSGIKVTPKDSGKGWNVAQEMLPDIPLGSMGRFKLALEHTGNLAEGYGDYKMSEKWVVKVESKELTDFQSFEEIVQQLKEFVALLIIRPVYALWIKAFINKPGQMAQGQKRYEEFEVFHKTNLSSDAGQNIGPYDIQICLPELRPNPCEFIERFFEKHQKLKPVCDLYFSTLYHEGMYLHQRFLSLAHAVEAYHRVFIGGKYLSDNDYQNGLQKILWDAIPQNVDLDFRKSLKNKLKYLHEFSLRKRVQDICSKFGSILKPFLGEAPEFADSVASQRNWLTHPDSSAQDRPQEPDWKDLSMKCEQLSLLLEVCLLHEIGINDQAISNLLPRNRRTRKIQLNKK